MRQPRQRSRLQGFVEEYAYPASSSDGKDPIHDVILPKCERSVGDVEHRVKAREVVLDLRSRCEEANSREMSPNAVGLVDDSGATVAADQFGAMVRGRLVVMARGSKIADGEPDAVRADQAVLAAYAGL